ncbi:hypothetical protein ACFP1H_04085 [Secundilactobacillus hailunensis]|uniref:Uncharacterized protein n=1 Tax=Secundilactobacillus hailunensis TaxID=2559923 RepID=A0ABW1T892_9LACO|nr:hypothetical protein [Secundilactobacillus hailunensis]
MNLKKQLGLPLVICGGLLLGLSATPANTQARTYVRISRQFGLLLTVSANPE